MSERRMIPTVLVDTVGDLDLYEGDNGSLFVAIAGTKVPLGSAWGPAADGTGEWFAWRSGPGARRVESREAAIAYITTTEEGAAG